MSAPQYLQLNKGGVYARMAMLKETVARSRKDNLPPSLCPDDWKQARKYGFHNWKASYAEFSQGFNDGKPVWYTHTGEYFRDERYCDQIATRLYHTGWFTDVYESEKARGIVARLPHGRFIAGYEWSSNGERVYFNDLYLDELAAAYAADGYAESFAERAREGDERFHAAQELQDSIDCDQQRLRECIVLRHQQCMKYVRDEIRTLIERIRVSQDKLETEFKGVL